jgi:hypothetical protein
MSDTDKRQRQDLYGETRRDLLTRQLSNSERYDGAILTLSTGALGISLTFIKDIVSVSEAKCLAILMASWWLFGLAIISTVISFLVSQAGINVQLEYAKQYYLDGKDEYLTKTNRPAKATDVINYISGLLFVIGVLLTILFVSANLGGTASMTEDRKSNVPLKEGAPVPNMQPIQGGTEKKGAPIPNMQPLPSGQNQTSGGAGSGGQSGSTTSGQSTKK